MGSVLVSGGGGWKQEKRGAVLAGSRVYSALHSNFKKDGDGGRQSTVDTSQPDVSTARPDDDTARPDVSTARPARSIITLKPLPTIDPKDKGKGVLEEPESAKKMTKSDFDAAQIARDEEIARQLEVELQAEELIADFVPIGFEEDERMIRDMNKKAEEESHDKESVDLILWGDLRTMFEANAKDELWQNQEEWSLKSWNFYENCGVHILILEDGTEIHMLAKRRYSLTIRKLERMLYLTLIVESASDVAYDLLRFIQK
uniref:Uncharacterized protein n=1 Tax=Tanacetum cinerariifolium TaxID=118510 RepID=A0A6L2J8J4_TANCI|nr:hypothetical protein [Tanacetum cinerariifolium]